LPSTLSEGSPEACRFIAAGLGIGALELYGAHVFGIGYQQAIAVLLLLLVLLIRLVQRKRLRKNLQ